VRASMNKGPEGKRSKQYRSTSELLALFPGRTLDNIHLEEYLDEPMDEKKTFKAVYTTSVGDQEPIDVVFKIVGKTGEVDPDLTARHQRIYESLRGTRHPNLPMMMALGSYHQNDYLMLEYIPGKTLEDNIGLWGESGSTRQRLRDSVRIIGDIANALRHLHSKNILHRTVHPKNIIVSRDCEGEYDVRGPISRAVLVGLGASKSSDDAAQSLEFEFNPFVAPEAELAGLSEASDVYSLGMCMYATITRNPNPPPAEKLNTGVYPQIDRICNRMISVQATRRPSLEEVLATLSSFST